MHLSASSTSSVCSRVAVWTVQSRGISRHTAPVSATASRHHQFLRSAASHPFVVPSTTGVLCRRCPMTWNSLPSHLLDPVHTVSVFGWLKTYFQSTNVRRIRGFSALMRYISSRRTHLLTYLHHTVICVVYIGDENTINCTKNVNNGDANNPMVSRYVWTHFVSKQCRCWKRINPINVLIHRGP